MATHPGDDRVVPHLQQTADQWPAAVDRGGGLPLHGAGCLAKARVDTAHSASALAGAEDRCGAVDPEQHIEAPYPSYLLCQDRCFVGTIKGVGKIYMQSVVDSHCALAFAKLALSKAPMTASCPSYEENKVAVEHLLTDNGREYCGRELHLDFELFLAVNQIAHRRTEVRSPETNGFCERFHRNVKEEFFAAAFRKRIDESLDQLQADLDRYLEFYDRARAHQGSRT